MWPAVIPIIGQLLDKLIPDPQAAADAKLKAIELAQRGELAQLDADLRLALGQLDVNRAEAATDMFRGGWRPMVGWVCAAGLAYQVVIRPVLGWASSINGWPVPPSLELDTLLTLLFGMLGLGAYRTYEKVKVN